MKKEKIKHIVLILMAVCLIGIGYLNYDYDSTLEVASLENQIDESTLRRCGIGEWECGEIGYCAK